LDAGILNINPFDDSLKVVSQDLPLAEQYAHPKWLSLRKRILFRDNYCCKACENRSGPLHIHHTIYQKGKFIWEVDEQFLMTLCPASMKRYMTAFLNRLIKLMDLKNFIETKHPSRKRFLYTCLQFSSSL
jgi:hypothetical protein